MNRKTRKEIAHLVRKLAWHWYCIAFYRLIGNTLLRCGASLNSKILLCLNSRMSRHIVFIMQNESHYDKMVVANRAYAQR